MEKSSVCENNDSINNRGDVPDNRKDSLFGCKVWSLKGILACPPPTKEEMGEIIKFENRYKDGGTTEHQITGNDLFPNG